MFKNKLKIYSLYFYYEDINNYGIFCNKIRNIVKVGNKYTFLIKKTVHEEWVENIRYLCLIMLIMMRY